MHDAANMPLLVMCQLRERKHASIVVQFQSIEILQDELPPILMLIADEVADAAAAVLVTVDMVMDMVFRLLLAEIISKMGAGNARQQRS